MIVFRRDWEKDGRKEWRSLGGEVGDGYVLAECNLDRVLVLFNERLDIYYIINHMWKLLKAMIKK